MDKTNDEKIKEGVRERYGAAARSVTGEPAASNCCSPKQAASDCCGPKRAASTCCGPSAPEAVSAPSTGLYSIAELDGLPDTVTGISLGCGNPTAIADLKPGEVVLDLGSGGGIDCFLAAKKVGPQGRVIGLDMTPDMVKLAQRNAKKVGATNVEFRYGEMEDMPLPDATVDVIISNCVINLSPDKDAVFSEAYRVLRPGGRMLVSDIVLRGKLPEAIAVRMDAWASCVAGALEESDYLDKMRKAGLQDVEVLSRDFVKISEFAEWESVRNAIAEAGVQPQDLDSKVASIKVKARKPA